MLDSYYQISIHPNSTYLQHPVSVSKMNLNVGKKFHNKACAYFSIAFRS